MDNKEMYQNFQPEAEAAEAPKAESTASATLNTLNSVNAGNENATNRTLALVAGIMMLVAAVWPIIDCTGFFSNGMYYFDDYSYYYYSSFSDIAFGIFFTTLGVACLVQAAGFIVTGIGLINKGKVKKLMTVGPILSIASSLLMIIIFFLMVCFGYFYCLMNIFTELLLAVMWAGIAMVFMDIKSDLVKKMSTGIIIAPAIIAIVSIIIRLVRYDFYGGNILFGILGYAALVIVYVLFFNYYREAPAKPVYQAAQTAGQTAQTGQAAPQGAAVPTGAAIEPDGYLGIVKLVVLGIVTFSIYLFIWIYRLSGFLQRKRVPSALQTSPGVQVVLCLFVPFYIIYWTYKQCKAIEDWKRSIDGRGDDLSLICLLLCIFGFSIVAFALMQDQVNKLVKPAAVAYSPNGYVPQSVPPVNQAPVQPQAAPQAPVQPQAPVAPVQPAPAPAPVTPAPAPAAPTPAPAEPSLDDQIEAVKKLKDLHDAGILTDEEFEAKKKQILGL